MTMLTIPKKEFIYWIPYLSYCIDDTPTIHPEHISPGKVDYPNASPIIIFIFLDLIFLKMLDFLTIIATNPKKSAGKYRLTQDWSCINCE